MSISSCNNFEFPSISPAKTLNDVWSVFDPTLAVDPNSQYYIPRLDPMLNKLSFDLQHSSNDMHAFLCGHRGSGKTTELKRLCQDAEINKRYLPIYLTVRHFGSETVNLTHDALMVEIGLELVKKGKEYGLNPVFETNLESWGRQIVNTYLTNESVQGEVSTKVGAWIAYFKAQLSARREWKSEQKQILEPRVNDLIGILNSMAQDISNKTGQRLLVIVDDLEKGESDAHREMHSRLFQENYETLIQPRFSIIYTIPIYFRALPGSRIPNDEIYAFSAARLYKRENKQENKPRLNATGEGYKLVSQFVKTRIDNPDQLFSMGVLDELLLIGGGLFRETSRAIREAAYFALNRKAEMIEAQDVQKVFNQIKKEYQPIIRGDAVDILKNVMESAQGWVPGVEPFLQSRAVVEYENDDLWIDLRYVLKPYIQELVAK